MYVEMVAQTSGNTRTYGVYKYVRTSWLLLCSAVYSRVRGEGQDLGCDVHSYRVHWIEVHGDSEKCFLSWKRVGVGLKRGERVRRSE